jgi:hypothetical protein
MRCFGTASHEGSCEQRVAILSILSLTNLRRLGEAPLDLSYLGLVCAAFSV